MESLTTTLGFGDALLWFGIFAALLLAMTVLARFRDNPAANLWLLIFLLAVFAGIFLKFMDHRGLIVSVPHLLKLNKPIGLCRPIALYLYIWYLLNPRASVRRRDVLHLLPVVAVAVYFWPVYALPAADKIAIMHGEIYFPRAHVPAWYSAAGVAYSIAYWALAVSAFLRSDLHAAGKSRSRSAQRMRRWIIALLAGGLVFLCLVALVITVGGGPRLSYLLFQYMSVLMVFACLFLLISARPAVTGETAPRYEKSTMTKSEKAAHAGAIRRIMETDSMYRQSGLRLADVSEKLGVPEHSLSQVINEEFQMSFSELVNNYRVEEAKSLLRSGEHKDFTIEGIGQEVGFRSRASFYSAFKRLAGMTPARYRDTTTE